MKKKVFLLLVLLLTVTTIPAKAANYEIKELIPLDTETTIVTKHFSYQGFYYNNNQMEADTLHNNFIIFNKIKNISDEQLPVSISVAFFDSDKKNIGLINYCSSHDTTSVVAGTMLASKEEKSYVIEVNKKYLADKKTVKDIKYISVLGENINCRTSGSLDFVGQTVEEIGMTKNTGIDRNTKFAIEILGVVAGVLLLLFIYKLLFTNAYENVNGSEVRQGYRKLNKELKEQREYEARVNPPKPKEPIKVKRDEVIQQEEAAKNEDKSGTDLHNMYK